MSERRSQAKEDLICDLQMNLKMARDCNKELQEELAAVTQERDGLKADTVRFNIHLEQKDGAIATNAKYCEELESNHPERVYILRAEAAEKERDELKRLLQDTCNTLHAYSQDNKHAEMARMIKERDHLRAEKLLILQQVTEYDNLIRDALQLPNETEWRVEFYAQEIRRLVTENEDLAAELDVAVRGMVGAKERKACWKDRAVLAESQLATVHAQEWEAMKRRVLKIIQESGTMYATAEFVKGVISTREAASMAITALPAPCPAEVRTYEQGAEERKQVERAERLEREAAQFRKWGNYVSATLVGREAAAIRRALPTQPKEAKDE